MFFTSMNTWNDIIEWPDMKNWMRFFLKQGKRDLFLDEYGDIPLRLAAFRESNGKGDDLRVIADQVVDIANMVLDLQAGKRRCLHLRNWADWKPGDDSQITDPENIFLIAPNQNDFSGRDSMPESAQNSTQPSGRKPAILIVPGGAYSFVSFPNEGVPIQNLMELHGYRAFILNYRTGENAKYPQPQMDLLETVKYLRENYILYGIDPHRIAVIGFSAGGHLVASSAGKADELCPEGKPDAVILGYPVITLKPECTHQETAENSCGGEETLRVRLNAEELVTDHYPPTFIWTLDDDESVPPVNTRMMESALEENQVKHVCCIYPQGGHGCGLGYGTSAWNWSQEMLKFLNDVFGK